MDVLTFLSLTNPYGIINWLAAAYILYVYKKTASASASVILLLLAAVNVLFGIIAVMA